MLLCRGAVRACSVSMHDPEKDMCPFDDPERLVIEDMVGSGPHTQAVKPAKLVPACAPHARQGVGRASGSEGRWRRWPGALSREPSHCMLAPAASCLAAAAGAIFALTNSCG